MVFLLLTGSIAAAPPEDFRRIVESEPGACAIFGDLAAGRVVLAGDIRVLDQRVPAGSWVKLFQAYTLAAGGNPSVGGMPSSGVQFHCDGWAGPGPRCWYGPGHGTLDLAGAVAHSCNAWFVQARPRLDAAGYAAHLAVFFATPGLGAASQPKTAVGGKPEAPPDDAWRGAWERGELTVRSPRFGELCRAVAALALGRWADWPESGASRVLTSSALSLDEAARSAVLAGMREAVTGGTAVELARAFGSADLLAKTSSMMPAAAPERSRNRNRCAMVCAFWPAGDPQAFVFLFVPRGFAPETAAPLAGRALRAFCLQRNIFTTEAQRAQSQSEGSNPNAERRTSNSER